LLRRLDTDWSDPQADVAARSFLSQMSTADLSLLRPHLETINVSRGTSLFAQFDPGEFVYFSQGPLISVYRHNKVEVALVGSEGLAGWSALAGCATSPYGAVVCGRDGIVLRLRTDTVRMLVSNMPLLGHALHSFVHVMNVQMGETISACASHRFEMRLARWILLRHDRVGGDEILVQHDEIAANLGTRRASVTDCLHILEGEGLVRCRRGRIIVRDRLGLEALAADCYGAAESFYRDALGSFGKSPARARTATHLQADMARVLT
jgi:CRP-like cAMP-binding protein